MVAAIAWKAAAVIEMRIMDGEVRCRSAQSFGSPFRLYRHRSGIGLNIEGAGDCQFLLTASPLNCLNSALS